MLGEEVELDGGFDFGAVDVLGPVPVVVRDGLESADAAARGAALEASASAVLFFELGEVLEELARTEPSLLGECDEIIKMLGAMPKPQSREASGQFIHGPPPAFDPACRTGRARAG
jgi:hypothetical protein